MKDKDLMHAVIEQIDGCEIALEIGSHLEGGLRHRITTESGAILCLYLADRHTKTACKAVDLIAGEVLVEMADEIKAKVYARLRQRRIDSMTILKRAANNMYANAEKGTT